MKHINRRLPPVFMQSAAGLDSTTPLAYISNGTLLFVETHIFTREITSLLPDEQYQILQRELLSRPEAGDIIRGSGGLRKIRWNSTHSGKRGGLRIIYYYDKPETIYMLFAYKKNRLENLTQAQLKSLSAIMKECLS